MKKISIALAGNPNCGKTTLFNGLTGLRHHTGNWPGKTVSVDRDEGECTYKEYTFEIIDLPGIYSLSSRTMEEELASDFILQEKYDFVVNVVDASHLEKNLFITLQLREIGVPVIVVLNMNNYAIKDGIFVDENKLQEILGVPVVKIEVISKNGRNQLLDKIIEYQNTINDTSLPFGETNDIHKSLQFYDESLELKISDLCSKGMTRWGALQKLLSKNSEDSAITCSMSERISSQKYQYINEILKSSVTVKGTRRERISQTIDKIVMNRILAIPIFLAIMFAMFQIVFLFGTPLQEILAFFFTWIGDGISILLTGAPEWVSSLFVNGIVGGIGTVFSFIPNIILMFLLLAILENSGYMARIAVIMDAIMKKLGLHGKSFIPMVLGFGCGVPAVMATRTLENEREKKLTMLLTPFMSCSARLPVYTLFISIFFTAHQGLMLFIIYIIGILIAILVGLILRKTAFKGEESSFILEMPTYHAPRVLDTILSMWDNAKEFLIRAGCIIFPAVLFIWLLGSLPFGVEYASMDSILGNIGTAIAPFFAPLGFGIPEVAVSVIMGLVAKEVVIGSLGSIFGVGETGLSSVLPSLFTPLSAFSFMLFILLYIPCLAALLTIRKESHSWVFTLGAALLYIGVAWIISFIVFQGGTLLGF